MIPNNLLFTKNMQHQTFMVYNLQKNLQENNGNQSSFWVIYFPVELAKEIEPVDFDLVIEKNSHFTQILAKIIIYKFRTRLFS